MQITHGRLEHHSSSLPSLSRMAIQLPATFMFGMAALVLAGWVFGMPAMTSVLPGFPTMKVNTALGFMLGASAILLAERRRTELWSRSVAAALICLMSVSLVQYPAGLNLGVDELFWQDMHSPNFPGRPSAATCLSFIMLAAPLVSPHEQLLRYAGCVKIYLTVVASIPATAFVTYLINPSGLFAIDFFSTMAIHTSLLFMLGCLALGFVISVRAKRLREDALSGASHIRRLIIPVVIIPLFFGIFIYHFIIDGQLSLAVGISMMTAGFILTSLLGLTWNASIENRWYARLVAESRAKESLEQRMGALMDSVSCGVLIVDLGGMIEDVNRGIRSMFGYESEELRGRHLSELLPEDNRSRFSETFHRVVDAGKEHHFQRRPLRLHVCSRDGDNFVVIANLWPCHDDTRKRLGVLMINGETVERQMTVLRREIRMDHLTSALNRVSLEARLQELDRYGARKGDVIGVIMLDVDHFKVINDSFGHPCGDRVLAEFARRVSESLRYSDSLYRYGGEEFTVVVIGAEDKALFALAERIREKIANFPFVCGKERIAVSCSVGVARKSDNETCKDALVRADRCLYKAKELGRNCTVMA